MTGNQANDIDEPWDEGASIKSSSPLTACVQEYLAPTNKEDALDDGELPALSLVRNQRMPSLLNGKTPTIKPLQPPSTAGLSPENRQDCQISPASSRGSEWDDDVPDDEGMMGMEAKPREMSPQSHEAELHSVSSVKANDNNVLKKSASDEHNFCDFGYVMDICGNGENNAASPARTTKVNLKSISDMKSGVEPAEEQTAIEVEYVEPPKQNREWSPEKKNSYLAAMARKAKADFKKTAPDAAVTNTIDDVAMEESGGGEDIYSSFNAMEKRKFLKLVNSGMAPTESAQKVLEEREGSGTANKRSLAFWKRSKQDGEPQVSPSRVASDDVAESNRKNATNNKDEESDDDSAEGSLENDFPKKSPDRSIIAGAAAVGATAAAASAFVASKDGNSEPDVLNKFEKSGKSYYDAVSRDPGVVEFIDDDMDVSPTNNSKGMRNARAGVIRNPKQKGFAALDEPGNKSTNASSSNDSSISKSLPRNGRRGKGAKQTVSSPDGSRRRFRLLGNRAAKFESLNENEDAETASNNRSTAIAAAAVGAAAVGATAVAISGKAGETDGSNLVSETKDQDLTEKKTVEQLEKDLLRPLGNVQEDQVQDMNHAAGNTPQHISTDSSVRGVEVAGADNTDLENYLDSTSSVYLNNNDQMSVISGRSHWTSGTIGTNVTTSSRSRRPGAAKQRLAEARKADYSSTSKKGWHDSMKNAAASSNQNWDPKRGFEGYKEQNEEILMDDVSDQPLRVNLKGIKKSKQSEGSAIGSNSGAKQPVVVPFPDSWEKDRQHMLNDTDHVSDDVVSRAAATAAEEDEEEEPNDWQKTMKVASAKLEKDGASWNPETGWQLSQENKGKTLGEEADKAVMMGERDSEPDGDIQYDVAADPEGVSPGNVALGVGAGSAAAAIFLMGDKQSDNAPISKERGDQSSATSGSSLNDENYVQLGDTGSVRAFSSNKGDSESKVASRSLNPALEEVNEEDSSRIAGSDIFLNSNEGAEVVEVVKQKNDEGDKNLFVHDSRNSYPNAVSCTSRRRGNGPVDIDEIDDMDFDDDDDDDEEELWASNQIKTGDMVMARSNLIAPSSPPKIPVSRKDTSSNRDRRARSIISNDTSSDGSASPERPHAQSSAISGASDSSRNSSSVKRLAQQWESGKMQSPPEQRDQELKKSTAQPSTGSMEWKSFLGKKVRAESAAAAAKQDNASRSHPKTSMDGGESNTEFPPLSEEDSLFEFPASVSDQSGAFPTGMPPLLGPQDNFSDLSSIQGQEDEDANNRMEQVSDTGTNVEQGSFLKRLQACAAPMMPRQLSGQVNGKDDSVPSEHLAFLRTKPDGMNGPQSLCARPDTISEETTTLDLQLRTQDTDNSEGRSSSAKRGKQRSSQNHVGSEVRSVVSEEGFGTKSSYLESLDMKAAVSNPKRSGSRGRGNEERQRSSAASDVSTVSRKSERWQEFLERKAAGGSPNKQTQQEGSDVQDNVSRASERYAAEKVELLMAAMSSSKDTDREGKVERLLDSEAITPDTSLEMSRERSSGSRTVRSTSVKHESARAAEELAAARVEAMMAAMTNQTLDEGEI
mmetsp:Transcript_22330/g.32965  ORF Transcript_22330/g.32965 Transcript_22330/m.32965 type:complete len:1559 (-) Transcript_22330:92-4768(-)|eukprot:CAMPEP_0194225808 /NCGR_PEP_ID=MMETSP0156-20130528/40407_1 /TAXON_ID=33649 /ORGANISM="Thalassionema nitzschioides, Strain L26-B" /LENGTH=1558 /DNA_ID=CAMNT_0038957907 /DNA_START=135 /DNA_END=4811 /DNA_ORIENTATION=-